MMKTLLFDIEGDGLLDDITQLWCMSSTTDGSITTQTSGYVETLEQYDCLIGHSIGLFDLPAIEKLYGWEFKGLIIDTLFLSWYLFPNKVKHGLEDWGEYFGYPKVKVEDGEWLLGDIPLMTERCERDVGINWKLWQKQQKLLEELY
jgi:hypothetical protein